MRYSDKPNLQVDADGKAFAWVLVANVLEYPYKHGNPQVDGRMGTKHFAPGAKLYVANRNWWHDGGDRMYVLGRHRGGTGKLHEMVLDTSLLENWRAKKEYSPRILAFGGYHFSEEQARLWAERRNDRDRPWITPRRPSFATSVIDATPKIRGGEVHHAL